jgi:hypothetical protein
LVGYLPVDYWDLLAIRTTFKSFTIAIANANFNRNIGLPDDILGDADVDESVSQMVVF